MGCLQGCSQKFRQWFPCCFTPEDEQEPEHPNTWTKWAKNEGTQQIYASRCVSGYVEYKKAIYPDYYLMEKWVASESAAKFYEASPTGYKLFSVPISIIRWGVQSALEPIIAAIGVVVFPVIAAIKGDKRCYHAALWCFGLCAGHAIIIPFCIYVMPPPSLKFFLTLGIPLGFSLLKEVGKGAVKPGAGKFKLDFPCQEGCATSEAGANGISSVKRIVCGS